MDFNPTHGTNCRVISFSKMFAPIRSGQLFNPQVDELSTEIWWGLPWNRHLRRVKPYDRSLVTQI